MKATSMVWPIHLSHTMCIRWSLFQCVDYFMHQLFFCSLSLDEPWTSEAKVFFDEDDTITATIVTPKEVYNIEVWALPAI